MNKTLFSKLPLGLALWLVSVPGFAYLTDNLVYRPLDYYTFLPPPLGGTYTDALFGTEVKRISDALNTLDGAWGDGRKLTFAMNEYATMSPFNSDHSWLILQHQSYFALYDGLGNYVRDLPYQIHASSEPRWSRSSADLLYFLSGNQLRQYQVSSNTVSVVHTFSEYSAISGRGESDICFDGNHFVLAGDGREIFVYEISTDSKGPVLNTAGGFDQLYITPNDNVIVGWYQIGYNRSNGLELYDRNMNYLRQLAPAIGHMDVTRDTTGEEILVWVNAADPAPICNNGVVKIRLSDGQQTCLLSLDWSLAIHISGADSDWVVVGTYAPSDPDPVLFWPAYTNELLQIKTDGSEVRRLLHHRSRPLNGYNYTPRTSLSRDASRLVYSSNYGLQSLLGYPVEYSDAYLVQLSTLVSTAPGDTGSGDTGGTTGEPAPPPPPPSGSTLTRVEENSTSVTYTGTWSNNVHSLHSGGSARLAMDAGSRATLSFTGSGVRWIAYCDEWSGIANVYLDGVLVSTADTYRSPAQAQTVIFSLSGLAAGAHTLAIEATGTRSPSSGGAWVWVDAFEVESDTIAPTVSITSPAADSTVAGMVTVSAGASDNVGVAGVQFRIDGANLEVEDTVAPYSVSWDTTSVGDGSHTLTAVARDAAGNSTVSAPVTVLVSNAPPAPPPPPPSSLTLTRIEESSTSVTFSGTWFNNVHSFHSGGSARLAMDAGSRATLSFTGSGVRWIAYCDEWSGIANVYLDGVLVSTVDTYRSAAQAQAVVFSLSGLAAGTHTLAIEATGTRSPSSGGAWVWVDAFEVESDTTAPTVSITSPAADSTVAGVVTVSAGASDNVGVAGVQFRVDGVNLGAEDTVAPYSVSWDTTSVGDGSHTLTAVARDAAGNSAVSAPVTVFVSNIPAPPSPSQAVRVEENGADVVYAGTWLNNVHSLHSGGSARLAMDAGSQVKFTFTGTAVSWIAYRDEWSGIAQIFLDGQPIARVDTYASPAQAQAEMYKITGLATGTHVLTIEATGERKAPSGGAWIWVDAFEFYP